MTIVDKLSGPILQFTTNAVGAAASPSSVRYMRMAESGIPIVITAVGHDLEHDMFPTCWCTVLWLLLGIATGGKSTPLAFACG